MPNAALKDCQPVQGESYYLDTSAVMALLNVEANNQKVKIPGEELARGRLVVDFTSRAKLVGALLTTSILAIEEIAAKYRGLIRAARAKANGYATWKDFKTGNPPAAAIEDEVARKEMFLRLKWTTKKLGSTQVRLATPEVAAANIHSAAETMRCSHLKLLEDHPSLDAMDALHIVIGTDLGATRFVSFDRGWDVVPSITVYN